MFLDFTKLLSSQVKTRHPSTTLVTVTLHLLTPKLVISCSWIRASSLGLF